MKRISYISGGLIWVGIVYLFFIGIVMGKPLGSQKFQLVVQNLYALLGIFLFTVGAYHGSGAAKELSPWIFNSLLILAGMFVTVCTEARWVEGPEGLELGGDRATAMVGWFMGGTAAYAGHQRARIEAGIDRE